MAVRFFSNFLYIYSSRLNCKRYINYRSFGPILRLLPFFSSPGSQVWALFAIANLTSTDKEKYCEFVVRENGIPLIQNILNDVRSTQQMINFAKVILENVASQQTHSSSNQ
jgi:Zyg-11 family protein